MPIKTSTSFTRSTLSVLLTVFSWGNSPADGEAFDFGVELWPAGIVRYRYCQDDPACDPNLDLRGNESPTGGTGDKGTVRAMMNRWEDALELPDPLSGRRSKYIEFVNCANDCPSSHVLIRYNDGENGNMCSYDRLSPPEKVGRNPRGKTVFHLESSQPARIILHELGHCLGLWHEFNRADADRWLTEDPDEDGDVFAESFGTRASLLPVVGNYDYDSILHYGSRRPDGSRGIAGAPNFGDGLGNALDKDVQGAAVSARDKSRLLQYYAWEGHRNWGFFKSLNREPVLPNRPLPPRVLLRLADAIADQRPIPYMAHDVAPVGTPAITFQSPGNIDFFVRGSDNRLYWGASRAGADFPESWVSLGCCFASDPAAISRADGEIDLVAIEADTGRLIWKRYRNGRWGPARHVRGGHPVGGIRQVGNGEYVGPAIASRTADSFDVFVVRSDGLLALTSRIDDAWTAWVTLRGSTPYTVNARPAAVALSPTRVQLAINIIDRALVSHKLYEPVLQSHALPFFALGHPTASTAPGAPPALASLNDPDNPFRVFIVNPDGRISHRFAVGPWRDIGGIPMPGTGPSAVAAGRSSAYILMNGEDATGCSLACDASAPRPNAVIQPGGLWLRHFE